MARIPRTRTRAERNLSTSAQASHLSLAENGILAGFVFDAEDPGQHFTVEILLDGLVVATCHATNFVPELARKGTNDGSYGFEVAFDTDQLSTARIIEARLANLGTAVGIPIDLDAAQHSKLGEPGAAGSLRWLGGLRFSGWVNSSLDTVMDAIVDGETVSQLRTLLWTRIDKDGDVNAGRNVRAFDFNLPQRFADGRVHRLSLRQANGEQLPSTATFVTFPDGLTATLALLGDDSTDQLRATFYDQLIPSSLPLADYEAWQERFPLPSQSSSNSELAIVIAGNVGAENTLATLDSQSHENWSAAVINGLPLAIDPAALSEFLADTEPSVDVLLAVMSGIQLAPNALARIAAEFDADPAAVVVYCDLDFLADDGRLWPVALPAFDYERMLEQGYCSYLFAIRRNIALELLQSQPDNLYRLFNSIFDRTGPRQSIVKHLPGAAGTLPKLDRAQCTSALASATQIHLNERGVDSKVTSSAGSLFPAVRVSRATRHRKTTVLIPTRDRVAMLRSCLDSIAPAVARSGADILVIDNHSSDPGALNYLADLPHRGIQTIRIEGPFNFAKLNNRAAAFVDSEVLCLLNNDIEATSDDWLDEMLSRLDEPDVGAVGAVLTWPGGVVQHGGVVLGMNFAATHAFTDRLGDDPGYLDLLRVAHECSAVTAACLVTRRADYMQLGGMDEINFAVAFNDVDYCLRLREAGKRIVLTPHARLTHVESASRGKDDRRDRWDRFERELNQLRARWGEALLDDPTYNPQLSRDGVPYGALAWPPGLRNPRLNKRPKARPIPPGF